MAQYAKAIVGAIIAGLTSLSTALVDGNGLNSVTDGQWVVAVIATLTALTVIWAVPNNPPA
jgi:sugar phosphate permease